MKIKFVAAPYGDWQVKIPRLIIEDQDIIPGKTIVEIEINGIVDTQKVTVDEQIRLSPAFRQVLQLDSRDPITISIEKIESREKSRQESPSKQVEAVNLT
jgi:hypothetical protein